MARKGNTKRATADTPKAAAPLATLDDVVSHEAAPSVAPVAPQEDQPTPAAGVKITRTNGMVIATRT